MSNYFIIGGVLLQQAQTILYPFSTLATITVNIISITITYTTSSHSYKTQFYSIIYNYANIAKSCGQ